MLPSSIMVFLYLWGFGDKAAGKQAKIDQKSDAAEYHNLRLTKYK